MWLAGAGARVKAVDISPVSVEKTMSLAAERGLANRVDAIVGDAEALPFPDDSFDVVWVSGVLHHTDVAKAYAQISRVLRPTGFAVMTEALGHNPAINYYRKRTPYLRSPDEHPLKKSEVMMARQYFAHVEFRFLYLASLAAVPFQGLPGARLAIRGLDICDAILLRVPGIRWHAWQVRMIARSPIKGG